MCSFFSLRLVSGKQGHSQAIEKQSVSRKTSSSSGRPLRHALPYWICSWNGAGREMAVHSQMGLWKGWAGRCGPLCCGGTSDTLTCVQLWGRGPFDSLECWGIFTSRLPDTQMVRELLSLGMTQRNPGNSAKLHLHGFSWLQTQHPWRGPSYDSILDEIWYFPCCPSPHRGSKMLVTNCTLKIREEQSHRRERTLVGATLNKYVSLWALHSSSAEMGLRALTLPPL